MAILSPDFRSSTFSLGPLLKSIVDFCVLTFEKLKIKKIVDFATVLTVGRKNTSRNLNPEVHVTLDVNSRKRDLTFIVYFSLTKTSTGQTINIRDRKYREKHKRTSSFKEIYLLT